MNEVPAAILDVYLGWDKQYDAHNMAAELVAARKVVALVRRWTSDHPDPCWCLLCNSIRRFDEETQ